MSKIAERFTNLSPLKKAFLALEEMQAKLNAIEGIEHEPIAIVGMGCRFPGGANNPESFWKLLRDGNDFITEVPPQRWDIDAYYDSNPETPGKMYTRWGGFLNTKVDEFDPQFFGIVPREAVSIDPQQRLLLEVSWEALENAGMAPDQLAGSKTGVFVGINASDYAQLQTRGDDSSNLNAYFFTGTTFSVAAGRLSYILGLQGPALALDTACSSSLVSVHLACQSLRSQECRLALAAGVSLMLSPQTTVMLSKMRALAPDGRCKTFDAAADGYGRGEGCGVIVLKRLCDAVADGDNILALIRGSAINHDGPSSGLTVPNGPAQQELLRAALAKAKVKPNQVSYVEVHGTGTALGDPIEIEALGAVFGKGRSPDQPVALGSVKTDIGHLEAAAGVAGLIKVVLELQHQEFLPHRHLNQLNPAISWDNLPVMIPTEHTPWSVAAGQKRLAGVSSFGMSGTNAHVVLEESPVLEIAPKATERPLHLLTLSAKTEAALKQLSSRYEQYLAANQGLGLGDICFTANQGRSHFPQRLSILAESLTQAQQKLANFAAGKETTGIFQGQVLSGSGSKVAFLFTGQGSQYVGMGRQLYDTQPTFGKALERCTQILRPYLDKPLLEVLYPQSRESSLASIPDLINETAYTQPALFALEYALAQLWLSWGIKPAVVMGHSVGEYVAACIAGVFSLEDGLKLIAQRGRLMQALPLDGEMVAVLANESRVQAAIQSYTQEVAIAAFNGPENIVISGKRQAVGKVVAALEADGVECKKLKVSHAFHSPLMEPMLATFKQVAAEVNYCQPQISLISNLTGELATGEIATPEYWCRHIRQPVRFAASTETLSQKGYKLFLEIGAKPTLSAMGRKCLASEEGVWLPSLRPGQDDWRQLLQSLGQLYIQGVAIDWSGFEKDYSRRKLALPTYPFQRQHYWVEKAHKGHQEEVSFSKINQQTPIFQLLQQEDTQNLAQELEQAGNFSSSEVEFLPKVLQVLAKKHNRQLRAATLKDWFYELDWQPQPRNYDTVPATTKTNEPGSWLILADQRGIGQALAELLQQQGQHSLLIYPGEEYNTAKTGAWSLNPSHPEDFKRLLNEHLAASELPLKGVVHLWSLEAPPTEELSLPTLEPVQLEICGSTLHLVQALAKYEGANSPQLWLVTQGAVAVKHHVPVAVAQASLWGLGKVVAEEHPELWGGIIDLDPEASSEQAATLLAEIQDSQGEDHLAFCKGQRYGLRLVRSRQPEELPGVPIKSDATYLITGGLGALGLKVAQWMVEQGAKHLVLIGRRGASSQTQATLAQFEQAGTQVQVAKADVSNQEDVLRVLQEIKTSMPTLQGIIHTAGVLRDGVLEHQNWELFTQVMDPKIKGAWNLHSLTQELTLDFFVVFSSATSFLGSPGQGNYAAANAFLDALAYYRQSQGMPGLSVNWGPWAEVGMTARMDNRDQSRMNAKGLELMKPEYGVQALEQLLQQSAARVGVFSIEWSDWIGQFPIINQPPYLKEIAQEVKQSSSEVEATQQGPTIFEQLLDAPSEQRQGLLIPYLQRQIAKVLELSDPKISVNDNLVDLGMDSLMVMEAINIIAQDLQLMLYPREFYERPRIESVASYLLAEFAQVHGGLAVKEEESTASEDEILESLRGIIHNLPAGNGDNLPAPVFVLSSPRSGSTLFRVMLAGHPSLFSPPELHLLPFNTMAERNQELALSYFGEGLQRSFMDAMELDARGSQAVVDEIVSQNLSIEKVYALLQQIAGTRQLVDKSPTYAMSRDTLERAEAMFKGAKYIYLTRHPYAVIESFVRMRMDKLVGASEANPYQVAEEIWEKTNHNILDFLQQSVAPERYYQIRYEELVKEPETLMASLCKFLNIPFQPEILQPYEGKRMTDGVHAKSMPIGDPNFAKYNQLDPKLGEVWKTIKLPHQLSESTQRVAARLKYELPTAVEIAMELKSPTSVPATVSSPCHRMRESFLEIRSHRLCLCSWGPEKGPLVLCLHGILEQGAAWEEVAIPLVKMGYRLVAPDLRGHGRSSHLGMGGASIVDLLADIDALVQELGNQPFTLVGHSMGSILAAMLASARPQNVGGLVLVETILPSPGSDSEVASQLATHLDYLANPPQHPVFPDTDTAATGLRQATPAMSKELSLRLAKRIVEPYNGGVRWRWDPLLRTRTMMSASGFPFSKNRYIELLRQIQAPITLVYGDSSTFNRKGDLSEQKAAMPQAKRVVLSGGHNLHIDAPTALADIVTKATRYQSNSLLVK